MSKKLLTTPKLIKKEQEEIIEDMLEFELFEGLEEDKEKQFEQFRKLYMRGVSNGPLLARTIGVHRNTIGAWKERLMKYFRGQSRNIDFEAEYSQMLKQYDELLYTLWKDIMSEDSTMSSRARSAMSIGQILRQKATALGFDKGDKSFLQQTPKSVEYNLDKEVYDYYSKILDQYDKGEQAKIMEEVTGTKPI